MTPTSKPLQLISWNKKISNKNQWFKDNCDYGISAASFGATDRKDYDMLYNVYNNNFPAKWFTHITDPLSAKVAAHKSFPAKIRKIPLLRTNIDQLMAEYPRRPFIYTVNNLGETGYNEYIAGLEQQMEAMITQRFQQKLDEAMKGQEPDPNQPDPVPEEVKKKFHASYKDDQAIRGQKWLRRAIREYEIRRKFLRMFKDWLIVGECASYKGMSHGTFQYEHIPPADVFDIGSPNSPFMEDSELIVVKRRLTVSEVVSEFYEDLTKDNITSLEKQSITQSPQFFYDVMNSTYDTGLVDVYHTCWKGKKEVFILHRIDPDTGAEDELEVDEAYPVEKEMGEWVERLWVNEIYETWRIGADIYVRPGAIPVQRNEMNNLSACKMPYNRRRYSDTRSENISVLEIGIPFQIMVIIITYILEKTIAKSKGKIALIDKMAIPRDGDWDEEKFLYYSEALGYGLLNRNQVGVDKSWNQYQVLDLSLFDNIKQLIELQDYYRQLWDDVIGFNRQRKGQTYASDLVGVNERATFQSTMITDMIFNLFEEFTERELQGILDFSKFVNIDGVKALWNNDVNDLELLEIDPVKYCNAELGLFLESSAEAIALKNKMEGNVQAMLQNKVKPSTVAALYKMQSIAEIETKLKEIEALEAEMDQKMAANEEEAAKAADDRKLRYEAHLMALKTDYMNEEYDRKEDIELIRGEFNTLTFQDGDSNDNGVPDIMEVEKHKLDREKFEHTVQKDNASMIQSAQVEQGKQNLKAQELAIKTEQLKEQTKARREARSPKTK